MRTHRSIAAMLLALGFLLAATGSVVAKGDAIVTLDEPLPIDPEPGSKVIVAWTLDVSDGNGLTLPFNSAGVFVRFSPPNGAPLEAVARQDREGHYTATVTVPEGGLGSPVFGLKGESCVAGGGCQRSDMMFQVGTEGGQPVPDPVAAPVAPPAAVAPAPVAEPPVPATVDLTWLPLVALVALAAVGFALLIRGRGRTTAT